MSIPLQDLFHEGNRDTCIWKETTSKQLTYEYVYLRACRQSWYLKNFRVV